MSNILLYQGDFRDWIPELAEQNGLGFKMLFADPPDNIKLGYDEYDDCMSPEEYRDLLSDVLYFGMAATEVLFVSYNAKHTSLMGHLLYEAEQNTDWKVRHMMQNVTFGQYDARDFGRCFRPLVRIARPGAAFYPDAIRVPSARQLKYKDKRANPAGKVPGDVWDFPRVTGTSKQRRKWHKTQLHEALYTRAIRSCTLPGDTIGDLFAGTGTMGRCEGAEGRLVRLFELSEGYCQKIAEEQGLTITTHVVY